MSGSVSISPFARRILEAIYLMPFTSDCDPGHDDACALILAGHSPKVHLVGVSTVSGMSPEGVLQVLGAEVGLRLT